MRRFRRRAAAGALACALLPATVLAGCGGDDGGGGGGEGPSGGTVNLGILIPLSGELAPFGKTWGGAAEIAVKDLNALELPGGSKIEVVTGDEETNPEVAVEQGRRMISTEDVTAIVGPTSGPMLALEPIAKRSRVPVISSSAGTVALNNIGGEWLYRTVASDDGDGFALARFIQEQGGTEAALLVENAASPISVGSTFRASMEEAGGTITNEVKLNPGQSSYRAEVGKAIQGDPEWVVCACGQQVGTSVVKELASAGYDGERMLTADLTSQEAIDAVGAKVMEGAYSGRPEADTSLPAYKAFAEKYQEQIGGPPQAYDANTYDAVALIGLAMLAADSTSGAEFNEQILEVANPPGTAVSDLAEAAELLKSGEDINYEGASGPLDMSESGTPSSSYVILEAKNGEWKQAAFYPASDFAPSE